MTPEAALPPNLTTALGLIYASLTYGDTRMVLNTPFMFELSDGQHFACGPLNENLEGV